MGQGQACDAPAPVRYGMAPNGHKLEEVCEINRGRKPLGQGSFGTVWKATLKDASKQPVAVKALDKKKMTELKIQPEMVKNEVQLMRECQAEETCVQLMYFIETRSTFFLVMEFCDGGNLEDMANGGHGALGEKQVTRYMEQLLMGIAFLHSKKICHRDVKPQNAMAVGNIASENVKVKLGDFGIAAHFQPGKLLRDKVGTPAFMAPEMHLLPNRSAGYDEKVDMWAAGGVMVFLLANEYPFVDGSGRLMRDQLLRGDLPLWDTDVFSGLFQRVKEVAGIGRKAPSKVARDLVRKLLMPKRQHRYSASRSLQHDWFKPPLPEQEQVVDRTGATGASGDRTSDDVPLLQWEDFEEGIASIERELQRMAAGVADAVGAVQIGMGGFEPLALLDPKDDRLINCVVCYQSSGNLGWVCPQCHYTVCLQCLEKLPKPQCPHCLHQASDVAITQRVARFARAISPEAAVQASEKVLQAALEAGVSSERLGKVADAVSIDLDVRSMAPRTVEEERRRAVCHFCKAPSSATNHVCPCCSASVCFSCAREELARRPHCPHCGDVKRNAAILQEYLAAGEAWTAAVGFAASAEALTRRGAEAIGALTTRAALATQRAPTPAASREEAPPARDGSGGGTAAMQKQLSGLARLNLSHVCFLCQRPSSSLDLACPACNATVCTACLSAPVAQACHSRCPRCGSPDFAQSAGLLKSAAQVRDSARLLWDGIVGVGAELLASPQPAGASVPPVDRASPSRLPPAQPDVGLASPSPSRPPPAQDKHFVTTVYSASTPRFKAEPVGPPDEGAGPAKGAQGAAEGAAAGAGYPASLREKWRSQQRKGFGPAVRTVSAGRPPLLEPPAEAEMPDWGYEKDRRGPSDRLATVRPRCPSVEPGWDGKQDASPTNYCESVTSL